ncbi:hypothetical protein RRF57_012074 [Xylaria bambusicola]|uniref:BZIP domain-containing protein n=1 Tax=Xylaria bambusicola TaxID=326684 RepID=A0AAN7ZAL7_9PEZI
MSAYNGRRGHPVNVSQLLQDLNRIPEPAPQPDDNLPSLDDELAMFTNTNFIDWDAGTPHGSGHETASTTSPTTERVSSDAISGDLSNFDFNLSGDFNGFDFHNYPAPNVNSFSDNLGTLAPIQPSPTYPPNGGQGPYGTSAHSGDKAAETAPRRRQLSFEEQSRLAAEEDKRRRNTAASARFRVKKKAREQALEKREKELSDKVGVLESRISSLETENKWLRELVMEKNGGSDSMVSALLEKQKPESRKAAEQSKSETSS